MLVNATLLPLLVVGDLTVVVGTPNDALLFSPPRSVT